MFFAQKQLFHFFPGGVRALSGGFTIAKSPTSVGFNYCYLFMYRNQWKTTFQQFEEAGRLFESGEFYDRAVAAFLRCKNWFF